MIAFKFGNMMRNKNYECADINSDKYTDQNLKIDDI